MIRTKLGLLGLCAMVVGMMTMSAGTAQGATFSWLLLNTAMVAVPFLDALVGFTPESSHMTLDGEVAGLKVAITCTNVSAKGVSLKAEGKLTEGGKAVFTGCKVYKSAPLTEEYSCTVKTAGAAAGTIETNEGKGELVLVGTKLLTKVEPKSGPTGNFATIRFEGASCVLPELNQVHGTLYLRDCQDMWTLHLEKHLVEEDGQETRLYIGGHTAKQLEVTKILGSFWMFLIGEHTEYLFGAMDV